MATRGALTRDLPRAHCISQASARPGHGSPHLRPKKTPTADSEFGVRRTSRVANEQADTMHGKLWGAVTIASGAPFIRRLESLANSSRFNTSLTTTHTNSILN